MKFFIIGEPFQGHKLKQFLLLDLHGGFGLWMEYCLKNQQESSVHLMWFEVLVDQGHGFVADTPIDGVRWSFFKKMFVQHLGSEFELLG